MWGSRFVVLVLIVVGLTAVCFMRVRQRTWMAPSALFWLYWCAFLVSTFWLAPSYTLTILGVAAIFGFGAILSLGDFVGATAAGRHGRVTRRWRLDFDRVSHYASKLTTLCIIASVIGCLAVVVYVIAAGYSLADMLSIKDVFAIASKYTAARYQHPASYREPNLAILFSIFVYVSALFGGSLFAISRKWRHKVASLLGFIPAFAISNLLTTRAAFLLTALLWLSSYFAVNVSLSQGKYRLFSRRRVWGLLGLLIISLGVYAVGQVVRQGSYKTPNYEMVIETMQSSFLGSTSSFTMWFSRNWDYFGPLGMGRRILSGPLQWILPDFSRKSVSTFPAIILGHGDKPNENTTVAALFREVIFDFSILGAMPFFLILGAMGGYSFRRASRGNILGIWMLSIFYGIALYSMMGFIFKFTVVLAAYVLYVLGMLYTFRIQSRAHGNGREI